MRPSTRRAPRLAFLVASAAALLPAAGAAQEWVQVLDGSPPGTPAEVNPLPQDSSAQETWFEVVIHGFWREDVVAGDGGIYQRIRVPGLRSIGLVSAAELPAVRVQVAVPTDADEVFFDAVDEEVALVYRAIRVYPQPIPGEDEEVDPTGDPGEGDTTGTGEVSVVDDAIYGQAGFWPSDPGIGFPPDPIYGAFPAATCEAYPMSFDAATSTLKVVARGRYRFVHPGVPLDGVTLTKQKAALAAASFVNWEAVKDTIWTIDEIEYHGRYAILASPMYDAALMPFVAHKKQLGYDVTVIHTSVGEPLSEMLSDVQDWYLQGGPGEDHYLLLVGDANAIPLGTYTWPETMAAIPTDDWFGTPADGSFHKEVWVGRLSVDGVADLQNQIGKIIDYELDPVPEGRYDRALLVAHAEDAPGKYQQAHEDVRTASYAHPPAFVTMYGSMPGVANAPVSAVIDQGTGVVAYRGHGATNVWAGWNTLAQDYHKNDVIGLVNDVHPVVWAITCTNGNIGAEGGGTSDCIAETWMEMAGTAGVASYGATVTTSTTPNHELDRRLFEAVYGEGLVVHGQAIAWAEQHVESIWPGHKNTWAYLLLGDPSMTVRRDVPYAITATVTDTITPCEDSGCGQSVAFQALGEAGEPLVGALVTLYKPSFDPGEPDEVHVTRYTDGNGLASLPVDLWTPGPMSWSVQDGLGNVAAGQIAVTMGAAWEDLGGGVPGSNGPLELVGVGTLQGGTPVTSILRYAVPDSVATLVLGLSALHAPFKGGIWVPALDVLIPGIPTGPDGVINLPTTWPMGFPPGFSFYEQYWMADPGAPNGFAGSNAIRGTTP